MKIRRKAIEYLSLLIIWVISPFAVCATSTDSLLTSLNTAHDTTRIHILNQLAYHYQFSDAEKAKNYLDSALSESQEAGFASGEAEALLNLGIYFLFQGENDTALVCTNRSVEIYKRLEQPKGMAEGYKNLGVIYYYKGDYPEAKQYYQQALVAFQHLNDLTGQAKCYANIGLIYSHYNEYQEALPYFLNSLTMNEALDNQDGIASCYGYIANMYNNLGEYTRALSYQEKALAIFKATGNKTRMSGTLSDMGNNYLEQKQYEKALGYYQQALYIAKELGNDRDVGYVLNNIANVYERIPDYPLALQYYTKSLRLLEKTGDKGTLPNILKNIAQVYVYLFQPEKSIRFAEQGLQIATEINSKKDIQYIHQTLSEAYAALKNYQQALAHHQLAGNYRDSIFNEEKTQQLAEIQARYDLDKKDQEITAQQKEITLLTANKITEKKLRMALIAGTALLMLLAVFIYSRYRVKQRAAQVLDEKNQEIAGKNEAIKLMNKELEKRMLRAQMDPHFIFNSLNAIQHFITISDRTSALKYLSKFSKLVRQTLENSIMHKVTVAEEVRLLEYYLELESLRFGDKFSYAIEIEEGLDVYDVEIPFLLLQPFVENAIVHGLKHKAGPGKIKIRLQNQPDYLHCMVEDNGIGRQEAALIKASSKTRHISRGMTVTSKRIAVLNSGQEHKTKLEITDLYDDQHHAAGTRVEVFIPLELN